MSICYLVIGAPRSGTSCIAGILYRLGIFMGDRLMSPKKFNPKGFYHDLDFEEAQREIESNPKHLENLIDNRIKNYDKWGVNASRNMFLFSAFSEKCPTYLLISRRNIKSIKLSAEKWFGKDSLCYIDMLLDKLYNLNTNLPKLFIDFDEMIDNPYQIVSKIAKFINCGITKDAIDFIDPQLRHYK